MFEIMSFVFLIAWYTCHRFLLNPSVLICEITGFGNVCSTVLLLFSRSERVIPSMSDDATINPPTSSFADARYTVGDRQMLLDAVKTLERLSREFSSLQDTVKKLQEESDNNSRSVRPVLTSLDFGVDSLKSSMTDIKVDIGDVHRSLVRLSAKVDSLSQEQSIGGRDTSKRPRWPK